MKFAKLAMLATAPALALAVTPIAANAQSAGTTIYSQVDESVVGTVESNDGTTVLVDTGDFKAPLPVAYFAERPVGDNNAWTINATKAQIDGMMQQQQAQAEAALAAALVEGAAVVSADGSPSGMVYTIDSEGVVIVKNEAGIVTLNRDAFAVNDTGALMALYSAEQLAANTVAVPEGAEILTPAQAAAKEAAEAGTEAS